MDLRTIAAVDLAEAIRAREVSSAEAVGSALERLKAVNEACNAVVSTDTEEALAAAGKTDAAIAAGEPTGPLAGVPLAHKDMFDRAGKIPSWGARIRREKPCNEDNTLIARLKAAGSIQIAALHLTEFAFGPTGHNYVLGHARNPWDPARITGGSSSGSAICVATGVVPAALGSDTAGSLRLPAAACNVASLKGTWTRVSRAGAMPLSPSLDCVGPIARDVRDLALLFGTIAGHDPRDGFSSRRPVPDYLALLDQPVDGLKLGVDERLVAEAHPEVQQRLDGAMKILEKAGARRISVRFQDWKTLDHLTQLLQLPEVASAHGPYLRKRGADYGPQVRARLEFGHFISGADHQTALRARGTMLARVLTETYANCDMVVLPTFADPLPTIAELDVGGGPSLMAAMARVILFTRPVNYLGLPALTLPYPREGYLPNGFQIVGRPFEEARMLAVGRAYQREVPAEVAGV
ncbi:MAG: amidase [Hyphomicrobiaceae bacterium]|nr:amidase [Hyphomicrobiaceae bacterium]